MSDIFISYASEDKLRVEPLAKALEDYGWSVWWDPRIPAGKQFDEVIEQAINEAKCIIVVWSSNSVSSRWVRAEASEGADRHILVPVLIEAVRIPLAFRQIQAAPLIDWDGSLPHVGFDKLVEDISLILGPTPVTVTARESPTGRYTPPVEVQPPAPNALTSPKGRAALLRIFPLWLKISAVVFAVALSLAAIMWIFGQRQEKQHSVPNTDNSSSRNSANDNPVAGSNSAIAGNVETPTPSSNVSSKSGTNTGDPSSATIATWNLQGFDPISTEKAKRLARGIAALDPAMIVLTEVNPNSVAGQLVDTLKSTGRSYKYTVLEQTAKQNIALLYKADVAISNAQLIPHSDDDVPLLRKALAANVRVGRFDFILIAVHLKSGRGAADREVRKRQVGVISEFIRNAAQGNEKDVLVLGNYNMVPEQDQANLSWLSADNFLRYISNELPAGQFTHISRTDPLSGNLLDGFAISRNQTQEYMPGTIQVFPLYQSLKMPPGTYVSEISDHLPLIARFRILIDDD